MLFEFVTARVAHDVKMAHAFGVSGLHRQLQRRVAQQLVIPVRHAPAASVHVSEMGQLHAQHGALDAFHPVIESDLVVVIARGGAVFAQGAGAGGDRGVVCHERAAFAARAEILPG